MQAQDDEPVFPCKVCGRKFIKSSLDRHTSACKKLSKLSRKPFDSGKQRATGSDITYSDVKKAQKEKEKHGGLYPRPQTNWKQRHEHFIDAVSASKKVDYAIKTGAPLPPPPKTAIPNDYVQCEYCCRNFNERAAERHIPFCREQHKKSVKPMTKSSIPAGKPPSSKVTNRDSSPSRLDTRGRVETRSSSREDLAARRRSLDSRAALNTAKSTRSSTQSANHQRANELPQPPKTRSSSATKNPSRLKTPVSHTKKLNLRT